MKCIRFDVAVLNPERLKKFEERIDMSAFLSQYGMPNGKLVFLDVQFDIEPDMSTLLKGFEDVKYVDYSGVPFRNWKYPFS